MPLRGSRGSRGRQDGGRGERGDSAEEGAAEGRRRRRERELRVRRGRASARQGFFAGGGCGKRWDAGTGTRAMRSGRRSGGLVGAAGRIELGRGK